MVSSDATSLGDAVSLDDAIDLMYETGWTDGLPVIPPTADRVKLCVDYTGRDPDEIIAELPPLGGKATVERIAVNAVMAGCLPEYMPVIITAIQALMDDRFNLRGVMCSTGIHTPLVIVSGSGGGARMHEGILSLMQMGKVSAALARFDLAGGLFISVMTNPTMGGVAASFASLGDFVIAEPKAMIGFAGPRVIKQTVNMELPEGFQSSEFLLQFGFVDRIIPRRDLRSELARLIDYCGQ